MMNFDFLDKDLGIVFPAHFVYDFSKCSSYYILSIVQDSLNEFLYFLRYLVICVLQLFVIQVVTSWILTLAFLSNRAVFST